MPDQYISSKEAVEERPEGAFVESAFSVRQVERAMCVDADHLQEAQCVFLSPESAPRPADQGRLL